MSGSCWAASGLKGIARGRALERGMECQTSTETRTRFQVRSLSLLLAPKLDAQTPTPDCRIRKVGELG